MKTKELKIKKWKSDKKLPKILRINRIRGLKISVLFSDGNNRLLDFEKIFKGMKVNKKSVEYKLLDPSEFKKVKIEGSTLNWNNVKIRVKGFDGKPMLLSYSIGADTLYEHSEPDEAREQFQIGAMIKRERIKAGLSQEDLGKRIGADKFYISRVEADRFHIEITTLRKIIEGGLHKKLDIRIR